MPVSKTELRQLAALARRLQPQRVARVLGLEPSEHPLLQRFDDALRAAEDPRTRDALEIADATPGDLPANSSKPP